MTIIAGIGSQKTSLYDLEFMARVVQKAIEVDDDLMFQSGGCGGPDMAVQNSAGIDRTYVHLPWDGFNGHWAHTHNNFTLPDPDQIEVQNEMVLSVAKMKDRPESHWNLFRRNTNQIMGQYLDRRVEAVFCSAPHPVVDLSGSCIDSAGGTGVAVRLAALYQIPCVNIQHPAHRARLNAWLNSNTDNRPLHQIIGYRPSLMRLLKKCL